MTSISLHQSYSPRHGDGSLNTLHIVVTEDLAKGRFKRKAGDALCKPSAKFWMLEPVRDTNMHREVDGFHQWGCKACQARAFKLGIDVNALRSKSVPAAAASPTALAGWHDYCLDAQPADYGWVWADVGSAVRPLYFGASNHGTGPWYKDNVGCDLDEAMAFTGEVLRWMPMTMPTLPPRDSVHKDNEPCSSERLAVAHQLIKARAVNARGEMVYRTVDAFDEADAGVQAVFQGNYVLLMQNPMISLVSATEYLLSWLLHEKIAYKLDGEYHHPDGRVEQRIRILTTASSDKESE